ncbi:hypothetical protein BGX38DRAFT_1275659 [Terfezia claveryi]|nr:hypothetical protein BGX38DRAFT_1275659 [Terfezia claveryi]
MSEVWTYIQCFMDEDMVPFTLLLIAFSLHTGLVAPLNGIGVLVGMGRKDLYSAEDSCLEMGSNITAQQHVSLYEQHRPRHTNIAQLTALTTISSLITLNTSTHGGLYVQTTQGGTSPKKPRQLSLVDNQYDTSTAGSRNDIKAAKALITIIANCEEEAQSLIEASLRFDDRKTTIADHITTFEGKWNLLRLNTATAEAGTNSLAAGIKNFINTDAWKATMLLATLPKFQNYQNIIDNITSTSEDPSYGTIVLRLKELSERSRTSQQREKSAEPPSAFATVTKNCTYCKSKGWPGTSHNESECRTKKRDQNQARSYITTTSNAAPPAPVIVDEWSALNYAIDTNAELDKEG